MIDFLYSLYNATIPTTGDIFLSYLNISLVPLDVNVSPPWLTRKLINRRILIVLWLRLSCTDDFSHWVRETVCIPSPGIEEV